MTLLVELIDTQGSLHHDGNSETPQTLMRIQMIAICGTGMGSLAGLLQEKGFEVSGSDDHVYPPMSDQLAALGINIKIGYRKENLTPPPDLVVVGNAVSRANVEVQEALVRKIPMVSMPEAIERFFLADRLPIVVAGTHGKTTTAAILSWLLEEIGRSPGFLVGGVLQNFGRSCQLGSGPWFVIEGDEYDSAFFDKGPKFLHYRPKILVLNAVEFDHADIYRDLEHLMQAFAKLVSLMPPDRLIVASGDHENVRRLLSKTPCRVTTFGLGEGVNLRATEVTFGEVTRFRLVQDGKDLGPMESPLPGRHNLWNLLGVLGVLLELGVPLGEIVEPLARFQGVKRRQEVLATIRGITVIDDFAHHPTAVFETLTALRARYSQGRLWALFEPRSNSTRRNIFQQEFVTAFEPADEIIIAPLYLPEKIPEGERLDPERLVEDLKKRGKRARTPSPQGMSDPIGEIVETVGREAVPGDVLCIMSNGSFGGIHRKIIQNLITLKG